MKRILRSSICFLSAVGTICLLVAWYRSHYCLGYIGFSVGGATTSLTSDSGNLELEELFYFVTKEPINGLQEKVGLSVLKKELWQRSFGWGENRVRFNEQTPDYWGFFFNLEKDQPWGKGIERVSVDIKVPDWLVGLFVSVPFAFWIKSTARRELRRRRGYCPNCRYDLRSGHLQCPECGMPMSLIVEPRYLVAADRLGSVVAAFLVTHGMRLTIACGLCLATAWTLNYVWEQNRTESEQIQSIIRSVCVDKSGSLDDNIASGFWRPTTFDIDLNGDGIQERIVLFYSYFKDGGTPEQASKNFDQYNNAKSGWTVNAMLLLTLRGFQWQAVSYDCWDYRADLHIARSRQTGLPYLVGFQESPGFCLAWGAAKRGGPIGPLVGIQTEFGTSQPVERFAIRDYYAK